MTTPAPLTVKFLRYIDAPASSGTGSYWGLLMRVFYEFWGFCVNGTDDLRHPGGFPTGSTSASYLSGVINMPVDWESGSLVLVHSNSDGVTHDGMPFFTGSNFTSDMVGKWLTVWQSGSSCTDDSIYLITKLYPSPVVRSLQGASDFTNSAWAHTAATVVSADEIDWLSGGTFYVSQVPASADLNLDITVTVEFWTGSGTELAFVQVGGSNDRYTWNIASGTLYSSAIGSPVSQEIFQLGNGHYQATCTLSSLRSSDTMYIGGVASTTASIHATNIVVTQVPANTGSVIGVDLNMGATPHTGSANVLTFTERSNVNYRVIDYSATTLQTTYETSNFIVLQLNASDLVNSGQLHPQVRLRLANLSNYANATPQGIAILMSPSGSWSGSAFTEGLTGGNSYYMGSLTNVGEFGPNSGNASDWGTGTGTGCHNIVAAQDFFLVFTRGDVASYSSMFTVEVPQRLYPQDYDPNPIIGMGGTGIYQTFSDGYSYAFGFHMVGSDLAPVRGWLAARPHTGAGLVTSFYNVGGVLSSIDNYHAPAWFNPFTNKASFSDVTWGTDYVAAQQTLSRVRLRRTRVMPAIIPNGQRMGDNGEWLHTFNGVLWPWDNAILPGTIFRRGG